MTMWDTPVLEAGFARLEPLRHEHAPSLADAVRVGELWRTWYTAIPAPDAMEAEIDRRLTLQQQHRMAPWAIIDAESGRAVGMTTYMNLSPEHSRLEIGSTWLGREAHGTGLNPAAKFALLSRAFESLGCIAVEFRTHWHNHQSREAIARLGAKQDGVLRSHQIMADGTVRDTVVFSILDNEWPSVRAGLIARIRKHQPS